MGINEKPIKLKPADYASDQGLDGVLAADLCYSKCCKKNSSR